jgi:hypothetical protein
MLLSIGFNKTGWCLLFFVYFIQSINSDSNFRLCGARLKATLMSVCKNKICGDVLAAVDKGRS